MIDFYVSGSVGLTASKQGSGVLIFRSKQCLTTPFGSPQVVAVKLRGKINVAFFVFKEPLQEHTVRIKIPPKNISTQQWIHPKWVTLLEVYKFISSYFSIRQRCRPLRAVARERERGGLLNV